MLSDRRRTVLSALVNEYVRSAQPVGSKQLVDRYDLRVSPATVRNELAVLEESGYVYQPHVSAGRVPTDSGYRAFVDAMMASNLVAGLTAEEIESIHGQYVALEHEVAEAMRETSVLLSRLTSYVAVVIAPTLRRARIRRVEPRVDRGVAHGRGRGDRLRSGRGPHRRPARTGERGAAARDRAPAQRRARRQGGRRGARRTRGSSSSPSTCRRAWPRRSSTRCWTACGEADADRVVTGGVSTLLAQPEFADPRLVTPLLHLLEDGLMTLQVLTGLMQSGDVVVRIGAENPAGLDRLSVVATNYEAGGTDGVVGVIGPTRMDYARAVSAVRTVADGLTEALG